MSSQNLCKSSHSHFHSSWLQISHRCICGSLLLHSLSLNAPRRLEMLNVHIYFIDRLISPINDDYLCIVCCSYERNSKFIKFHFLGGELLAWVLCQDLSSLSLWEDNLLICNSCPILVLRLVNIASCDQNVWQMQKTPLRSLFNLDIKSE